MEQNYKKQIGPLALGLTRQPMFMGVNLRLFFANLMLSTLVCIDAHTFWGVPWFVLLHLVMVRLSVKEPNFFTITLKAWTMTPPVLNRWYWGRTNSYSPW